MLSTLRSLLHRRLPPNPQISRVRVSLFSSSSNGSNNNDNNNNNNSSWSTDWGADWGGADTLSSWSTGLTKDHFDGQDSPIGVPVTIPESPSSPNPQPQPTARQTAAAMDEEDDLVRMLEADNRESRRVLDSWDAKMMETYKLMKQVREPGVRGEYLKDSEKKEMYRLYKEDPEVNSVEKLAKEFRVMRQRVHAILWLKEMEEEEEKRAGKPLDDSVEILLDNFPENKNTVESDLTLKNLQLSSRVVAEILQHLNATPTSALRFFNWVLHSGFKPTPKFYNLVVNNLGRAADFKTMLLVLNELSQKHHCLTEKAFSFVTCCSGLKDSVRMLIKIFNQVGGSCRASGFYSLIRVLCGMSSFDLAVFVMEEAGRKTSYYNVLIAAKCRTGDFQGARKVLDEMTEFGCDPNISSYNYLLGSLFKHDRVTEACELMEVMEGMGYLPDAVTFEIVVFHACKTNRIDFAVEFLNRMLAVGIRPRLTTHAVFIKGYFWAGRVEDACKYVVEMSMRDRDSVNVNYTLLARLYWSCGRVVEAGGILHEMMTKSLKPNFSIYVKVTKDLYKMSRGDLASELKSMYSMFWSSSVGR